MSMKEQLMIEGIKAKDSDSISLLMNRYSNKLIRAVYLMTRDEKLAEDIVQEAFVKLVFNIHNFKGDASLYTYLYRIALNECRQKMRKNWFKRVTLFDKWFMSEKEDQDFERTRLDKMTIAACIAKMDYKYKEVILLYYYEDMAVRQIGEVLEEKEGTIKSRLKRGRDLLKNLLKEAGYPYES